MMERKAKEGKAKRRKTPGDRAREHLAAIVAAEICAGCAVMREAMRTGDTLAVFREAAYAAALVVAHRRLDPEGAARVEERVAEQGLDKARQEGGR